MDYNLGNYKVFEYFLLIFRHDLDSKSINIFDLWDIIVIIKTIKNYINTISEFENIPISTIIGSIIVQNSKVYLFVSPKKVVEYPPWTIGNVLLFQFWSMQLDLLMILNHRLKQ